MKNTSRNGWIVNEKSEDSHPSLDEFMQQGNYFSCGMTIFEHTQQREICADVCVTKIFVAPSIRFSWHPHPQGRTVVYMCTFMAPKMLIKNKKD